MFWKIAFYTNITLLAFTFGVLLFVGLASPTGESNNTYIQFSEVITFISTVFGVAAMYGLAYKKDFLYREFWIAWALVIVSNDIVFPHVEFIKYIEVVGGFPSLKEVALFLLAYVVELAWSILFVIALYLFGKNQKGCLNNAIT